MIWLSSFAGQIFGAEVAIILMRGRAFKIVYQKIHTELELKSPLINALLFKTKIHDCP
jgi:hypothetical protein